MIKDKSRFRTGIVTHFSLLGAVERCRKHNKVWSEGADFEENGGKACKECIEKSRLTKYKE